MDQLTEDYRQEKLDHARESHYNRDGQLRELALQDELRRYKAVMVGVPSTVLYRCRNDPQTLIETRSVMPSYLC